MSSSDVGPLVCEPLQKTLALIKTDLLPRTKQIEEMIQAEGLVVLRKRRVSLRSEQAARFCRLRGAMEERVRHDAEIWGDRRRTLDEEPSAVDRTDLQSMSAGPIDALILAGHEVVTRWLDMIGPRGHPPVPGTLRFLFGAEVDGGVYGSPEEEQAKREVRFFFPDTKFESDLGLGSAGEYLSRNVNEVLLKGLLELCRVTPPDPVLWLARWLLENRPNEPV